MPKLPSILALSLLSYGLIFPTALAIFPNRYQRNDLLIYLRQRSLALQWSYCLLCYETVGDLTATRNSNYWLRLPMGVTEEDEQTLATEMRTLLVEAAQRNYGTTQISEEFRLPECTDVVKRFVLPTVTNNPEILDSGSWWDRRAATKKFVKEYQKDAEDQYNCDEVFGEV